MGDMLSVFKMKKTRTQPLFYERGWKMDSKKKSQMCFTDGGRGGRNTTLGNYQDRHDLVLVFLNRFFWGFLSLTWGVIFTFKSICAGEGRTLKQ